MLHSNIVDVLFLTRLGLEAGEHAFWIKLIKARQASMMRRIKELGQSKLGSVNNWATKGDIGTHVSNRMVSAPVSGERKNDLSLDMRGVFVFDRETYTGDDSKSVRLLVYGFSRHGKWVVADISFGFGQMFTHERSCEVDKMVKLSFTSPDELIKSFGVKPRTILRLLSDVVEYDVRRREDSYRESNEMRHMFEFEDELIASNFPEKSD